MKNYIPTIKSEKIKQDMQRVFLEEENAEYALTRNEIFFGPSFGYQFIDSFSANIAIGTSRSASALTDNYQSSKICYKFAMLCKAEYKLIDAISLCAMAEYTASNEVLITPFVAYNIPHAILFSIGLTGQIY